MNKIPIERDDLVLDIGANVGEVSGYYLDRGARVIAFEPNPHARQVLELNLGSDPKMTIRNEAVGITSGTGRLYLHENHLQDEVGWSTGGSLLATKSNVSEDFIEVPVVDIIEVLQDLPSIKVMKIDIEGTEYELIEKVLDSDYLPEYLVCESHHYKNPELTVRFERVRDRIEQRGLSAKWTMDWIYEN
ncbi:MAG: FkbM family methyltransferase [Chloroflexi bacterium]|nr:FkbM family methyltransferase [Chloroflexota bacterium]